MSGIASGISVASWTLPTPPTASARFVITFALFVCLLIIVPLFSILGVFSPLGPSAGHSRLDISRVLRPLARCNVFALFSRNGKDVRRATILGRRSRVVVR